MQQHPTTNTLTIKLTPKQYEFYKAYIDPNLLEILVGGGGRGGKTWGIVEIIVLSMVQLPGIKWLVGRREWDDLKKSTLKTFMKVLMKHGFVAKTQAKQAFWDYRLNMQEKELTLWNGSGVYFVPLKDQPGDPDFNWLGGYEITHDFIDEAQEVSRKAIDVINTRKTEKVAEYGIVGKTILSCNPSKGHLYSDFIKPAKEGKITPDRVFIQSLYKDNPHIDHAKYEDLYKNADQATKERLLKGNWEYDSNPYKLMKYDAICDLFTNAGLRGKKFITCDVARLGKDKAIISVWDGFVEIERRIYPTCLTTELAAEIKKLADHYQIPMRQVIVDEDGVGGGVRDILGCRGFVNNSKPFQPKSAEHDETHKVTFEHLKAQCYFTLTNMVNNTANIRLIDDSNTDTVKEELDVMSREKPEDEKVYRVTSKEKVKEILGRSPDFADTIMMRMFFEVAPEQTFFVGTF